MERPFRQIDVFTTQPYRGNPVAVILEADGLSTEQMQRMANWTNLSETTFVLPPQSTEADYRVRIFTPTMELPFAGHPTLGTCHAWLEAGGEPAEADVILQECDAGLIPIRRVDDRLGFAAPPLTRSGPVEEELVEHLANSVGVDLALVRDAQWVDNGPGWVGLLFDSAQTVLELQPGPVDAPIGVVGPYPEGGEADFEVRAFVPMGTTTIEDPVTGSLNASFAQWLLSTNQAKAPYLVSQGTVLGRSGRVHITEDDEATIWVGGGTVTCFSGVVVPD